MTAVALVERAAWGAMWQDWVTNPETPVVGFRVGEYSPESFLDPPPEKAVFDDRAGLPPPGRGEPGARSVDAPASIPEFAVRPYPMGDALDPAFLDSVLGGLPEPEWSSLAPSGLLADLLERAGAAADAGGSTAPAADSEPGAWARRHEILAAATFAVVERIGGWERVKAWADAHQARELARLVDIGTVLAPPGREEHETLQSAAAEVAAMNRLAPAVAARRVENAARLYRRLPDTWAAVRAGTISLDAADRLVAATLHCSLEDARRVEAKVLPTAASKTAGDLRRAAARAVLRIAPEAAAKRHRKARADRKVVLQPALDGMVHLGAIVPAEDGVAMFGALDAFARANAAKNDPRGIDARRSDALVDLVLGRRGPLSGAAARRADIRVTVAASTLLGLDEHPGELAGYGPITADVARALAENGIWRRLLTDPVTGGVTDVSANRYRPSDRVTQFVAARDQTCRFPGCRVPAQRCDVDHNCPHDQGGPSIPCNLCCLCRKHHMLKTHSDWRVRQDPDGTLTWTAPSGHVYTNSPPPAAEPRS